MIDPSSLRKGNWVLYQGKPRMIEEIGKFGTDLYGDYDGEIHSDILFEDLDPIDISPELLSDLGFQELAGEKYWVQEPKEGSEGLELQGSNYRKTIVHEEKTYVFESVFDRGWCFQDMKLIHQPVAFHHLQNLFYYLTGQELQYPQYE